MILFVVKYFLFAGIATAFNLTAQYLVLLACDEIWVLYIAMCGGTLAGLVVKYILDKKYIFGYTCRDKKEDGAKFVLYSFMGVCTTLIFWMFEISFEYMFEFSSAKYYGATIGLSIGYTMKYFLDKKFVFNLK